MADNTTIVRCIVGGINVHTHLKGRIFSTQGVSYLVLQEESESPEWLKVKSLNGRPKVQQMHAEKVRRYVGESSKA